METRAAVVLALVCTCMVLYLAWDLLLPLASYRDDFKFLWRVDEQGRKLYPRDLINYASIVNQSDEYLNSISPSERLYNIVYHDNLFNNIASEGQYSRQSDLQVSSAPVANRTLCAQQMRSTLDYLRQHANSWRFTKGKQMHQIARFLDSFGKPESNFHSGSIWWTGSYESCLKTQLQQVKMRYCWTRWRFGQWRELSEREHPHLTPKEDVRVGACLPEACDSRAIDDEPQALAQLVTFDWPKVYQDQLELHSIYCLPDERSPLRQMPIWGRVYLALVAGWVLLVLGAHWVRSTRRRQRKLASRKLLAESHDKQQLESLERQQQQQQLHRNLELGVSDTAALLLGSLSVSKSMKRFFRNDFRVDYKRLANENLQAPRVDLSLTNSIKFLMYLGVVAGHVAYQHGLHHTSIEWSYQRTYDTLTGSIIISFGNVVDSFFMMFGAFSGYYAAAHIKQLALWKVWLAYNLRSVFRIMPVYLLVYGFVRFVSPYMGSGPWWDYGTYVYTRRGGCIHSNWTNALLYWSMMSEMTVPCVPPAWFLHVYFQACLVVPLLVWLICKLPNERARIAFVLFMHSASVSLFGERLLRQTSLRPETFTLYPILLSNLLNKFEIVGGYGTFEQLGLITWGCYAGHLLHRYEIGEVAKWPRWMSSRVVWFMLMAGGPVVLMMPVVGFMAHRMTGQVAPMWLIVLGTVATKFIWPTVSSLLFFLGTTVYSRTATVRFFSHSFWHSCNRLGLFIFLIHWEILEFAYTVHERAPNQGADTDYYKNLCFAILISIVLAVPVFVLFQAPINSFLAQLYKQLEQQFGGGSEKTNTKSNVSEEEKNVNETTSNSNMTKLETFSQA